MRTLGIALIIIIGLLNFHVPHFLFEPVTHSHASRLLEVVLLANLIGGVITALGIYHDMRWGWVLGVLVAGFSIVLYLFQETVGLPGLPQSWWEPSRIVSLIVEASFLVLAWREFRS